MTPTRSRRGAVCLSCGSARRLLILRSWACGSAATRRRWCLGFGLLLRDSTLACALTTVRPLDEMAWRADVPMMAIAPYVRGDRRSGPVRLGVRNFHHDVGDRRPADARNRASRRARRHAMRACSPVSFARPVVLIGSGIAAGHLVLLLAAKLAGLTLGVVRRRRADDVGRDADRRVARLCRTRETCASDQSYRRVERSVPSGFSPSRATASRLPTSFRASMVDPTRPRLSRR